MAGTGVAAAGVAVAMPSARAATPAAEKVHGVDVDGPVIAHVRNAATGEISIMHGEREVVVHDHDLVARLTRNLSKEG